MANITGIPFDIENYIENYTCNIGLLLPAINEYTWSDGARAFLYLFGLLWCFLAVAIIADVFMCSIERITSKTRAIKIADAQAEGGFQEIRVRVWNDTVANLSLLALGTSAPEILLSVIEIVGKNFHSGELGPGTIVGSATFNLFVISGICIVSIPNGETRKIENMRVYAVTTVSSIFAYVWLIIIIKVSTPGVVDIWEATLTLLGFPSLILIAYAVDKKCFCKKYRKTDDQQGTVEIGLSNINSETKLNDVPEDGNVASYNVSAPPEEKPEREELLDGKRGAAEIYEVARLKDLPPDVQDTILELGRHKEVPPEQAAKFAAARLSEGESHSRGWYRIQASREMSGGKRLIPSSMHAFDQLYNEVRMTEEEKNSPLAKLIRLDLAEGGTKPVVEFTAASCSVLESAKKVRVGIKRYGRLDCPVTFTVETIDGTATAGEDYIPIKKTMTFAENEKLKELYIDIVDDYEWEPDEFFFAKLTLPADEPSVVGNISINQITIIDDDEPGKLEFSSPSFVVKESQRKALINVKRINGADGHVSVKWATRDMTAIGGQGFQSGDGLLEFGHGETLRTIEIPIITTQQPERDDSFAIDLGETDGGAELGRINKTIVTIVNDDEFNGLVSRIVNMTVNSLDALRLDTGTWKEQFETAMNVNGGDVENATLLDYILHFCTFFWKVLFAFVPPPSLLGGWATFIISLGVIGFLTAIIGDLAKVFGCLIGLEDSVTAITLVALGTSMPDTFASKTAALMEKTADSSIGNINGSNSVNVFLGLGLPWLIASIYWAAKGLPFEVKSGTLVFSVVLYTIFALVVCAVFLSRRFIKVLGGAELGGPTIPKYATAAFVASLWLIYVLLSSLQAYGHITAF